MKTALYAVLVIGALGQSVAAEEGAYFGLGIVGTQSDSVDGFFFRTFSGSDVGLALTAGYRFASSGNLTYGIEGNLDLMSGKTLADGPSLSCANFGPSWCEVDAIVRLRGTMAMDLSAGSRMIGSLGAVVVTGRAEDGENNYVDTTGRGLSVGVAWEKRGGGLPLRIDLNYDTIKSDNANDYDRTLDIVGLRVSYMF